MNRRVLFLLLIVIYLPRMLFASAADDVFSENLAKLIGAPASALRPLAEAYSGCGQADPEGAIATFGELTREAAAFATSETLPATRALLSDFTRQLVVQTTAGTPCESLAQYWNEYDPIVRMSVDNGIGLAESDLRAAVRLEQMGAPIWSDDAVEDARNRVLAQWDRYDGPDEGINRVFLTRLNAWTPGVEAAWKDLSQEGRLSTTRITFDGHAPDAMTLHAVLGTDQVLEWVGSSSFSYTTRDLSPYQNVINAALAGYFGGQSYVELISGYNIAINAMNDMTYSSVAFGTIFDLMDMNAQRER